jgi:DNA-directed RNA polymerase specialized sigma24 family protein
MMYATSATGGRVKGRGRPEAVSAPVHDFDRLFRDSGPRVWRTMYAFTGGRRDVAEEAVAEAFARAIAHSGTIRDPLAWIYRTAFRVASAELKRERRRLLRRTKPARC